MRSRGSEAFLPADMKDAPEVVIPKEFETNGHFTTTCPPQVQALYTRIWAGVLK